MNVTVQPYPPAKLFPAVADPGFPVGGHRPCGGAPTPEAAMFRKICVSKRKNLDCWGGGTHWQHPLDPPMPRVWFDCKNRCQTICRIWFCYESRSQTWLRLWFGKLWDMFGGYDQRVSESIRGEVTYILMLLCCLQPHLLLACSTFIASVHKWFATKWKS